MGYSVHFLCKEHIITLKNGLKKESKSKKESKYTAVVYVHVHVYKRKTNSRLLYCIVLCLIKFSFNVILKVDS
jgi:hypothetical protein